MRARRQVAVGKYQGQQQQRERGASDGNTYDRSNNNSRSEPPGSISSNSGSGNIYDCDNSNSKRGAGRCGRKGGLEGGPVALTGGWGSLCGFIGHGVTPTSPAVRLLSKVGRIPEAHRPSDPREGSQSATDMTYVQVGPSGGAHTTVEACLCKTYFRIASHVRLQPKG